MSGFVIPMSFFGMVLAYAAPDPKSPIETPLDSKDHIDPSPDLPETLCGNDDGDDMPDDPAEGE